MNYMNQLSNKKRRQDTMNYIEEYNEKIKSGIENFIKGNMYGNYNAIDPKIMKRFGLQEHYCATLKKHSIKMLEGFTEYGKKWRSPNFTYAITYDNAMKALKSMKKYSKKSNGELKEILKNEGIVQVKKGTIREITLATKMLDPKPWQKKIKSVKEACQHFFGRSHKSIAEYSGMQRWFTLDDPLFDPIPISTLEAKVSELSSLAQFFQKRGKLNEYDFFEALKEVNQRDEMIRVVDREPMMRLLSLVQINLLDAITYAHITDVLDMLPDEGSRDEELLLRWLKQNTLEDDCRKTHFLDRLHKYQIGRMNRNIESGGDDVVYDNKTKLDEKFKGTEIVARHINTAKAQRLHGKSMRHCIGNKSYRKSMLVGDKEIWEITADSRRYTFYINNRRNAIIQASGVCNGDVPDELYSAVEQALGG